MSRRHTLDRRTVLKSLGAIGAVGAAGTGLSLAESNDGETSNSVSTAGQTVWVADQYPGHEGTLVATTEGGYAAAENNYDYGPVEIHNFDHDGNLVWTASFDGSEATALGQNADGEYYLGVKEEVTMEEYYYETHVVKTTAADGTAPELAWKREFDSGEKVHEYLDTVVPTDDGVVAVGARERTDRGASTPADECDIWAAKLADDDGSIVWEQKYNLGEEDRTIELTRDAVDTGDGIAIFASVGVPTYTKTIVKIDYDGNEQWRRSYDGDYKFFDLADDGGFVLAGYWDDKNYQRRSHLLKTDSKGDIEWTHDFVPFADGGAYLNSFAIVEDGYLVGGPADDSNSALALIDDEGDVVWRYTVEGRDPISPGPAVGLLDAGDGEYVVLSRYQLSKVRRGESDDGSNDGGSNGDSGEPNGTTDGPDDTGGTDDGTTGSEDDQNTDDGTAGSGNDRDTDDGTTGSGDNQGTGDNGANDDTGGDETNC